MARKKYADEPDDHNRWVISYADFITLLFALFTIAAFRVAGGVKHAFFGFLPSDLFETDEINAIWIYHQHA